jgi:hypothetical protein
MSRVDSYSIAREMVEKMECKNNATPVTTCPRIHLDCGSCKKRDCKQGGGTGKNLVQEEINHMKQK